MNAPRASIHQIAPDTWRISVAMPPDVIPIPGGFSFNQYLVVDEKPLLFHTGPRKLFPLIREQITVLACMHGSAWTGNGGQLLRSLGQALGA